MSAIQLVDTTLRDGQQCLWATRMTTAAMLPIARQLDMAGFSAIEVMGAVQFDAAVRYLNENPWQRLRLLREQITETPLQAVVRSNCILGFEPQAEDLNKLWVERLIANGVRKFAAFDGLHDIGNLVPALKHAKSLGAYTTGWLTFSDSPVHTDELYAAKAREFIERADVDALMIEDASGVLTPERVRTLVPAIRQAIGDMSLGLHSHGLAGLPQRTYLAAAELGVDNLYTCIPPVADGNAPPSVSTTMRNLKYMGFDVTVDPACIEIITQHFESVAREESQPIGRPMDYDAASCGHQVPGGVMSNLQAQLRTAGLEDKLPEVLEECTRVRADLGWPIQVTPFAQFIGVQATLNVMQGERYATVPNEVKKYALGYYGKLLSPVDPNVLDKIMTNGSRSITEHPPEREPVLPFLRQRYPDLDDEERMLRHFFDSGLIDQLRPISETQSDSMIGNPLIELVRQACQRKRTARVFMQKEGFRLELRRNVS